MFRNPWFLFPRLKPKLPWIYTPIHDCWCSGQTITPKFCASVHGLLSIISQYGTGVVGNFSTRLLLYKTSFNCSLISLTTIFAWDTLHVQKIVTLMFASWILHIEVPFNYRFWLMVFLLESWTLGGCGTELDLLDRLDWYNCKKCLKTCYNIVP